MDIPVEVGLGHRGGLQLEDSWLAPPSTTFAAMGGRDAIARLVDGLYDRIEADRTLRPAFGRDLAAERSRQRVFFEGWFGGDRTYFDDWRPGLKIQHEKIVISRGMAGKWVGHFLDAFAQEIPDPELLASIKPFVTRFAMSLVNHDRELGPKEALRISCSSKDIQPLRRAVRRDDGVGIADASVECPAVLPRHGTELLLLAAGLGKEKACRELLRHGVDPNRPSSLSSVDAAAFRLPTLHISPICAAVAMNRESVVTVLLEAGAKYDFFSAACVGDLDAIQGILAQAPEMVGAFDPACDLAQVTPLMHAVYAGRTAVARLLLERGACIGANGVRLLRAAANAGDEELTSLLLRNGANPQAIGAGSWTLHPVISDELLSRGANVNYEPGKWIGLCCTGNSGHKENVPFAKALLQCGADVSAIYKGRTAVQCASQAKFGNILALLREFGADFSDPLRR